MDFNVSKCKVVHFGRANPKRSYVMNGQLLASSDVEKDIGVIISNDLKPSQQCAAAAKKANITLGRMARAVSYRNKSVWLRLYQIYVRPQLEYAIQAWRPWLSKDIEVLERVQRRAVRMTSGLKGKNYEEKLAEVGLQSLEDRRERGDAIQIWKILTKYDDVEEENWFNRRTDTTDQTTRLSSNSLNLQQKTFRHEYRKNSFSVRGPKIWNKLPDTIRGAKNLRTFKNEYDKLWREQRH